MVQLAWRPRWYEAARLAPSAFLQARSFLRGRQKRKLGNNTYLIQEAPDTIVVRFHATNIIRYPMHGAIYVDTRGWNTMTTKARLNGGLTPSYFFAVRGALFVDQGYRYDHSVEGWKTGGHRHDGVPMESEAVFWPHTFEGRAGFFLATDVAPPPWATGRDWNTPPPDFRVIEPGSPEHDEIMGVKRVRTSRG